MKKTVLFLSIFLSTGVLNSQNISTIQQRKLFQVMAAVNSFYADSINGNKITDTAIIGVLKELDPHSTYTPADEVQRMREPLEGSFEGIGVQFSIMEDTINVVQTIAGCPAEKVGVLPGDQIIYIDKDLVAGVKVQNSDVFKRLRGKRGTEVTIKVRRNGTKEPVEFKIIRDKIPIYSVDATYMADKNIGYIKINSFGSTTANEFRTAFQKLKKQGMKDLILSLQMNGGGYLGTAIELADEFLSAGKLIVYTQGARQARRDAQATARGNFEDGRIVVLVDEYSASASEIVSGALQDWDRAVIVGRRTFGKGLVQQEMNLVDSSALRLTVSRYYTPSERCIQKPYKDGAEKYYKDLFDRSVRGELMHVDSIHFPDSLKHFTKIKHRTVYGGGGIMPDVFVPIDTTSTSFHRKLVAKGLINKVTLQYVNKNRQELKKKYPSFEKFYSDFEVGNDVMKELWSAAEKEKITGDTTQLSDDELKNQVKNLLEKNNRHIDVQNEILGKLLRETSTSNNPNSTENQYSKSSKLIKRQIKALIAGDIWSTSEYYQVIDSENESLQKAIEILKTPNAYENILR